MAAWRRFLFSEVFRHMAISFADRTLLSLTHFAVSILFIRRAPAADYGLYVLAQAGILLAFFAQSALITIPMTVLAPKYEPTPRRHFINTLAQSQYLIWLPLCMVVALCTLLGRSYGLDAGKLRVILAADVITLFVLLREFIRFVFFVYMRPRAVLCVDAIYGGLFLAAVYWVTATSTTPALHTIIVMGLANLLAGTVGLVLFHRRVGWTLSWTPNALATALKQGKWALLGVSVTWLQTEGFLYMLGGLKGTAEVASVSASRLLLMPVIMLTASVEAIIKPRGAAWLASGEQHKMEQGITLLTGGTLVVAASYIGCILLAGERLAEFFFSTDIADIQLLLLLWGVVFLLRICSTNLNIVLQVFERFDTLFYVGFVSALISLTIGYWTIQAFGAPGSLLGLLVVEVINLAGMVTWVYWRQQFAFTLPRMSGL